MDQKWATLSCFIVIFIISSATAQNSRYGFDTNGQPLPGNWYGVNGDVQPMPDDLSNPLPNLLPGYGQAMPNPNPDYSYPVLSLYPDYGQPFQDYSQPMPDTLPDPILEYGVPDYGQPIDDGMPVSMPEYGMPLPDYGQIMPDRLPDYGMPLPNPYPDYGQPILDPGNQYQNSVLQMPYYDDYGDCNQCPSIEYVDYPYYYDHNDKDGLCNMDDCKKKCLEFLGYEDGKCSDNKCYCKTKADWTYKDQDAWYQKYPQCGKLVDQSPKYLDINDFTSMKDRLEFWDYDLNQGMILILENKGHGLRMYVQANQLPTMKISGVKVSDSYGNDKDFGGKYTLAFVDFHWAISEHSINGIPGDLEAQFHHFDLKYDTYEHALAQSSGVTVMSVLFKISDQSDLHDSIFDNLLKIQKPGLQGTTIGPQKFLDFFDEIMNTDFAPYVGSETIPPCTPGIHWLVAQKVLMIKEDQIKKLQQLRDSEGNMILNNVRNMIIW